MGQVDTFPLCPALYWFLRPVIGHSTSTTLRCTYMYRQEQMCVYMYIIILYTFKKYTNKNGRDNRQDSSPQHILKQQGFYEKVCSDASCLLSLPLILVSSFDPKIHYSIIFYTCMCNLLNAPSMGSEQEQRGVWSETWATSSKLCSVTQLLAIATYQGYRPISYPTSATVDRHFDQMLAVSSVRAS